MIIEVLGILRPSEDSANPIQSMSPVQEANYSFALSTQGLFYLCLDYCTSCQPIADASPIPTSHILPQQEPINGLLPSTIRSVKQGPIPSMRRSCGEPWQLYSSKNIYFKMLNTTSISSLMPDDKKHPACASHENDKTKLHKSRRSQRMK